MDGGKPRFCPSEAGMREEGWGVARLGVVDPSPAGGIGGLEFGTVCAAGVWPGREVGVYSVVWFAVGGAAGHQSCFRLVTTLHEARGKLTSRRGRSGRRSGRGGRCARGRVGPLANTNHVARGCLWFSARLSEEYTYYPPRARATYLRSKRCACPLNTSLTSSSSSLSLSSSSSCGSSSSTPPSSGFSAATAVEGSIPYAASDLQNQLGQARTKEGVR